MKRLLPTSLVLCSLLHFATAAETLVWVGCYTDNPNEQGISLVRLDEEAGQLSDLGVRAPLKSPSFLTLVANGWIYAVSEMGEGGKVFAFKIETPSGTLRKLSERETGGAAACHVAVDTTRRTLITADYLGENISVFALEKDGSIKEGQTIIKHEGKGPVADRQSGPHPHGVYFSPKNDFVLVPDLGADKLFVYKHDPDKASLTQHTPPSVSADPGAGPRHGAWGVDGTTFYLANELDSTVTVMQWSAAKGTLTPIQKIATLPQPPPVNKVAEIAAHPNGKFLYVSNRGHDTLASYSINAQSGKLTFLAHTPTGGKVPRQFAIHPNGKWLIVGNQESSSISLFALDPATGTLTPSGKPLASPKPVCFAFWVK